MFREVKGNIKKKFGIPVKSMDSGIKYLIQILDVILVKKAT